VKDVNSLFNCRCLEPKVRMGFSRQNGSIAFKRTCVVTMSITRPIHELLGKTTHENNKYRRRHAVAYLGVASGCRPIRSFEIFLTENKFLLRNREHARVNYDMCIIGVSPSVQTVTASRCCGFAAVGPAVRRYRSIGARPAGQR